MVHQKQNRKLVGATHDHLISLPMHNSLNLGHVRTTMWFVVQHMSSFRLQYTYIACKMPMQKKLQVTGLTGTCHCRWVQLHLHHLVAVS